MVTNALPTAANPDAPGVDGSRRVIFNAALLALLGSTVVVTALPIDPIRPFAVVAAASIIPGAAIMTLMEPEGPLIGVALAVALSLMIDILGGLALIWTGFWHPPVLAGAVGVASGLLLVRDLLRGLLGSAAARRRV